MSVGSSYTQAEQTAIWQAIERLQQDSHPPQPVVGEARFETEVERLEAEINQLERVVRRSWSIFIVWASLAQGVLLGVAWVVLT